jgi:hypothetical protein
MMVNYITKPIYSFTANWVISNISVESNIFNILNLFANGEKGAWYDPSDISTLFQDAAGTIPVTADGQPVGLMLDKSGNGNHASQSVSSKRPTYRDVGGVQWIEADGIDDFLTTSPVAGIANDADGMSLMMTVRSTGSRAVLVSQYDTIGNSRNFSSVVSTMSNNFEFGVQNNSSFNVNVNTSVSANYGNDSTFIGLHEGSGGRAMLTVNGVSSSSNQQLSSVGSAINQEIMLFTISGREIFSEGRIYGLIIRGKQSNEQEVTNTEEYLTALTVPVVDLEP